MNNTAKIIEVVVSPNGQTTVQTRGFAGDACRHASKALEQALGVVEREQLTAEFHQSSVNRRQDTSTG
jgi:hypothetical protein